MQLLTKYPQPHLQSAVGHLTKYLVGHLKASRVKNPQLNSQQLPMSDIQFPKYFKSYVTRTQNRGFFNLSMVGLLKTLTLV